jgi:hypothetical protein
MGEVNVQRRGVSRGVLFVLPAHECTQKRNGVNTSSTSYSINFFCIGVHIRMQRCYAGSNSRGTPRTCACTLRTVPLWSCRIVYGMEYWNFHGAMKLELSMLGHIRYTSTW